MKRFIICLSLVCIAMFTASCSEQAAPGATEDDSIDTASSGCNYVFVRSVILKNSFDPRGPWRDPEIELISKAGSTYKKRDYPNVNQENELRFYNDYIGYSCDTAIFYWNERDGTDLDVTVSYKGISLNTKIDNDDDLVGAVQKSLSDMRFWPTTIDLNNIKFEVCAVPYLSKTKNGGVYSEAVKHLQRRLSKKGHPYQYGTPAYFIRTAGGADGYFGNGTHQAVIALQKMAFPSQPGEWDGKVGSQTWGALSC